MKSLKKLILVSILCSLATSFSAFAMEDSNNKENNNTLNNNILYEDLKNTKKPANKLPEIEHSADNEYMEEDNKKTGEQVKLYLNNKEYLDYTDKADKVIEKHLETIQPILNKFKKELKTYHKEACNGKEYFKDPIEKYKVLIEEFKKWDDEALFMTENSKPYSDRDYVIEYKVPLISHNVQKKMIKALDIFYKHLTTYVHNFAERMLFFYDLWAKESPYLAFDSVDDQLYYYTLGTKIKDYCKDSLGGFSPVFHYNASANRKIADDIDDLVENPYREHSGITNSPLESPLEKFNSLAEELQKSSNTTDETNIETVAGLMKRLNDIKEISQLINEDRHKNIKSWLNKESLVPVELEEFLKRFEKPLKTILEDYPVRLEQYLKDQKEKLLTE